MRVNLPELPMWALVAVGVLALASVILDVMALLDLYRRPTEQVVLANKWIWVAIVLVVSNGIGAVIYLAAGRRPAIIDTQVANPPSPSVRARSIADALYGPRDNTGEQ